MYTVLIVDDEEKFRALIRLYLRSEGLEVIEAADGRSALQKFRAHEPDIVLLDVMLPDISGFDVCKKIREASDVPILFLSALEDEGYHVVGYRAGADDYIAKPFQPAVFALKVKRILERTKHARISNTLKLGDIELDMDAYTCVNNGEQLSLTQKEFALLCELIKNAGRVLTREYLLREIWGYTYVGDIRAVDTLIKKLRKKLGPSARHIKTVISVGYKAEETI